MRKLASAVAALAFGAFSSSGLETALPLVGEQAFTESVAKLYDQTPGVKARVVAPLRLVVHTERGDFDAYLNTAFSTCQRNAADCESFIRNQVKAMATAFAAAPRAPTVAALRVTVRPVDYVDQIAAASRDKSPPVAEPLIGDLWVIGVLDEPTTISTISQSTLEALKLDAAGAIAAGKRNVEAAFGAQFSGYAAEPPPGDGVKGLTGNDYLASLLALPDLWQPLAERFDGRLYVAVPASDHVLFADARTNGNLVKIVQLTAAFASRAKRPVSTDVFEWTPTGWEVVDLAKAD